VGPLLDVVFLWLGLVCQPPFCVILVEGVFVNSSRLPKRHAGVRIMNGYIAKRLSASNRSMGQT
jgi:hypothetical protein